LQGLPYLSDLHDEATLHHLTSLQGLQSLVLQEYQQRAHLSSLSLNRVWFDDYHTHLWCGVFTSESLWRQYTGRIETVEGIDMSAINELMESIPKQETEMKSIRLSQWNAQRLHAVTHMGAICLFPHQVTDSVECGTEQSLSEASLWEGNACLSITESGVYHGIAVFTVLQHVRGDCTLSSDPLHAPDSLQYFRCFEQASSLEAGTQLHLSARLTVDNRFVISLEPPKS
jgi:hypothetical protein